MTKTTIFKTLFFSITTLLLISCNSKTNNSVFNVVLEVVVKENDSIHVFYTSNGTIDFNEKQSFWTTFKGNIKNQKISINFPKDSIPNQLRFDFGRNKYLQEIILNKVTINFKTKQIVLKGKEIYKLFRVDQNNTILDRELGILKRKNASQINGPSLYPNGELLKYKLGGLTATKNN